MTAGRGCLVRNVVLLREAGDAIAALRDESIPVLVIKGAALLDCAYDMSERAMGDVDLLVSPRDASRGRAALERAGFQPVLARRRVGARLHHAGAYLRTQTLCIDLHTAVAYPPRWRLDTGELFERSRPWTLDPTGWARRPCGEDLVLHTCVAQTGDELRGAIRAARDIRRLAERLELSWSEVAQRARRARCTIAAWLTLRHARLAADAPVPAWVESELAPGGLRRFYLERLLDLGASTPYRFPRHQRRLRQALLAPAATDDSWRFAVAAVRFAALRAADAAVSSAAWNVHSV